MTRIGISVDDRVTRYSPPRVSRALIDNAQGKNQGTEIGYFKEGIDYVLDGIHADESHEDKLKEIVQLFFEQYDALVVPGNSDHINPRFYSGNQNERDAISLGDKRNRRTKLELALVQGALERGVPVLGICGGNQVINVALGGKIIDTNRASYPKTVTYLKGTQLHNIIKEQENEQTDIVHRETSLHQQTIDPDTLPYLLLKAAQHSDGMIKAVELRGHHPWLIGTQFHPEDAFNPKEKNIKPAKQNIKLFQDFLDAARMVKEQKSRKEQVVEEIKSTSEKINQTLKSPEAEIRSSNLHELVERFSTSLKGNTLNKAIYVSLQGAIRSLASAQYVLSQLASFSLLEFIGVFDHFITNSTIFIQVLNFLPEQERFQFADYFQETIVLSNWGELAKILTMLPENERLHFANYYQNEITDYHDFDKTLATLPQEERADYFQNAMPRVNDINEIVSVLNRLPKNIDNLVKGAFSLFIEPSLAFIDMSTSLHQAALTADMEIAYSLTTCILDEADLNNIELDVNVTDKDHCTPLHYACRNANYKIAEELLESKEADPNIQDNEGQTPLHYVANNDRVALGLRLNAKQLDLEKYSLWAIEKLVANHADVNIQNNEGHTALHCAVINNRTLLTKGLLDLKVNLNIQDIEGKTAIHHAVLTSNSALAIDLMKAGADLNIQDKLGRTPLHYAIEQNNYDLAAALIKNGANLNLQDNHSNTVLHLALQSGNSEIATLIIDNNPSLNLTNQAGKTALHYAAKNRDENVMQKLIEKNASLNAQDKSGNTALHYALFANNSSVYWQLLQNPKIDFRIANKQGKAALDVAYDKNLGYVIAHLEHNGAARSEKISSKLNQHGIFCQENSTRELLRSAPSPALGI